jgi:5-methylcytosine-specific restriction endonuclease McrA
LKKLKSEKMAFTKEKRIKIHAKYNGHCAYCGCEIELTEMQTDHIIPKYQFAQNVHNKYKIPAFLQHLTVDDLNHIDNLNPACGVCNKWKSYHDLELFRNELTEQINRLNKYSSAFRIAKRYALVEETAKPVVFYFETIKDFEKIEQYIDKLMSESFEGWTEDAIRGYLTACESIKQKTLNVRLGEILHTN